MRAQWTWFGGEQYKPVSVQSRRTVGAEIPFMHQDNPLFYYDTPGDCVIDAEDPATIGCLQANACNMFECPTLHAVYERGAWQIRQDDTFIAAAPSLGEAWISACWKAMEIIAGEPKRIRRDPRYDPRPGDTLTTEGQTYAFAGTAPSGDFLVRVRAKLPVIAVYTTAVETHVTWAPEDAWEPHEWYHGEDGDEKWECAPVEQSTGHNPGE